MNDQASENFIFEITKEIIKRKLPIDIEEITKIISKVIVDYDVHKIQNNKSESDLKENLDTYLTILEMDGISKSTIKSYRTQLDNFIKDIHINTNSITTSHIRNYLSKYGHLKKSSMATKVSTLKSFFAWLLKEEIISKDPMQKIKTPKFNKHNPKYLNIDELEMMRESCTTLRERALLEVLYATGVRLCEIFKMNISEINFNNLSTKVIGKGSKEREVYFSVRAMHHLKRYLDSRNDDCDALFITERKPYRRMKIRAFQRAFGKIVSNSPIDKHPTCHAMRHTFSTLSLDNGMDLTSVQSILGHADPATTMLYCHVTDEHKREQYKKHLIL